MPRVRLHGLLLTLALALAFVMRFWGLREQGLRFVDEGEYCFFGACILHGTHGQIIDKPGHGLLIFLGFQAFGFSMASALFVSAALGFLSVVLLYKLARDLWGGAEALIAACLAATLPFWLYYQRSSMSDGNYLFFSLLGWWLGWRAADRLDRWSPGRGLLFAASGLAF
ncbi:MAG: hypothetical protein FJ279_23095, partial [Planctomycetes bacterium]|nr:hypothetical protein [Planctomycetota bacterium]